jgi:O-antigen/teichoic acid export membrane protein
MRGGFAAGKLRQQLGRFDGHLLRGSIVLSLGSALARVLAMGFWLILARAFTPAEYGYVQYYITIGMLIAGLTQPTGQFVLARYVGKHQADAAALRAALSNLWVFLGLLMGLTLALAIPALYALDKLNLGVLVIFVGVSLFYAYWGLASGMMASAQLTAAYLGSNLIQLLAVFGLIFLLDIQSPLLALLIYGLSYFAGVALVQRWRALPLAFEAAAVRRAMLGKILRFSRPVWVSHVSYTLYAALPILLLERHAGAAAVGVFGLATTLTAVFGIVSTSISTLLLPKIASTPREQHRRMLLKALALLLVANAAALALYVPLTIWFVGSLLGGEYLSSIGTYTILALATIVSGVQSLGTAVLMGTGRAWVDAGGRLAALLVAAALAWIYVPSQGAPAAAAALLAGSLAALLFYLAVYLSASRR